MYLWHWPSELVLCIKGINIGHTPVANILRLNQGGNTTSLGSLEGTTGQMRSSDQSDMTGGVR